MLIMIVIFFPRLQWLPELRQYAPKATLFLVGTKTDLVDDPETLKSLKAVFLLSETRQKAREKPATHMNI